MSQLFKLEVDQYSIGEMQELLNLDSPYTLEDIVNNENSLREKLLIDDKVSATKKEEIITFLGTVKQKLMGNIKEGFKTTHALITTNNQHNVIRRAHTIKNRKKIEAYIGPDIEAGQQLTPNPNLIRHLLCIDSRFRDNYYSTLSTNYLITLPTRIKNVISMELAAFDFPNTYYQISKSLGNNYFWLGWSAPMASPTVSLPESLKLSITNWFYITIPDGNYVRDSIERVINEQIVYATKNGLRATVDGPQGGGVLPGPPSLNGITPPQCVVDSASP